MSSSQSKQLSTYFITFIIILVFVTISYSLSNSSNLDNSQVVANQKGSERQVANSQIFNDLIFLSKDSKLKIGKTCLNFRGIDHKSIIIDLYLLELDAKQPYTKKFDRKNKKIQLGNNTFKLLKTNDNFVKLKLLNTSQFF